MEKNLVFNTIIALRSEISKHDSLYDMGRPEISDTEYDKLYKRLEALEAENPEFADPLSPTQKISSTLQPTLEKVTHTVPMLSQDKVHTEDEIRKFCSKADISKGIIVSQKLDGLTAVTRYNAYKLQKCITRGNGHEGEDITGNVLKAPTAPKNVTHNAFQVRSEAIIPFEAFERTNAMLLAQGEAPENLYKNPRNLASGTIRSLKDAPIQERGVELIAFDLVDAEGIDFSLDTERFAFLEAQGFKVVPYEVFYSVDDVVAYCLSYNQTIRPNLPYPIDGLVLTFNDLSIRASLGFTNKFPRWGCAFKFEDEVAETTLRSIEWSVGRTGVLTPVGVFDSVELDGTDVCRASLHNMDNIIKRGIMLNAEVLVEKANQIIPQIISLSSKKLTGSEVSITVPDSCPDCGGHVIKQNVDYYCTNPNCSKQLVARLYHFASKNALNIDGFGEETAVDFIEKNIIHSIAELFDVQEKRAVITQMEGYGEKTFNKLLDNIEKAKQAPLHRVLYALGIPNVGTSTAKVIAKQYPSMELLLTKAFDPSFAFELQSIKDIGAITANGLVDFLKEQEAFIQELFSKGMTMVEPIAEPSQGSELLSGKVFVITGDVHHFTNRKALQEKIESLGGKATGSVSAKTSYLINNDKESKSSKNKKALELNIPILSEEDFLAMIAEN